MQIIRNGAVTSHSGADSDWAHEILAACPSLVAGCRPSTLARNRHVQSALTVLRDRRAPEYRWDRVDRHELKDGGLVSVSWSGLDEPAGTPVLLLLHTICGSADALRRMAWSLRRRLGWVIAAPNRRGHAGLALTVPVFNTMGSTDDLRSQLDHIGAERPGSEIYAVGVSAGSGLLVRYLGEEGSSSRIRAAVAVCPAYDVPAAFRHVEAPYDRYMTRRLIDFFLNTHAETLRPVRGFEHCAASRTMLEFHERMFPMAGFSSFDDYLAASDPMRVAADVRTPMLVINAADDPVCAEANVHRHLDSLCRLPRVVLSLTRHGSHCGFFESLSERRSWLHRATAEFLQAASSR